MNSSMNMAKTLPKKLSVSNVLLFSVHLDPLAFWMYPKVLVERKLIKSLQGELP